MRMDRPLKLQFVLLLFLFLTMFIVTTSAHRKRPSFCDDSEMGSTFLWTLPNRDPPVYFFGTIHVPYTRVWDYVPWPAKRAFERADSVFFELDLTDAETVAQLASCQMLPSGETLSDVLPGDIYRRLKRHLDYVKLMMPSWMKDEHKGLYAEYLFKAIAGNWEKKRPVWVMLMVNSLTESEVRTRGIPVLDLHLAREAARLGKRSGAVEKVEEQCLPLNGLNVSQVFFALNQTLLFQESLRYGRSSSTYGTEDLVRQYNCGNLGSIVFGQSPTMANSSFSADELLLSRNMDRYFRRELIEKRNARMADRVLHLISQYPDESFFFAFGAGHFLGNSSVLDYVEAGGFKVEQVAPDAKIKSYRRPHHHPRSRGSHETFGIDMTASRGSWEEGHRRRYRKRGHMHHGVQLLRTVSTTAPARVRQQQQHRQFNDLWVKLDNRERSENRNSHETSENRKRGSKMWYSVPSAATEIYKSLFSNIISAVVTVLWCRQYLTVF